MPLIEAKMIVEIENQDALIFWPKKVSQAMLALAVIPILGLIVNFLFFGNN